MKRREFIAFLGIPKRWAIWAYGGELDRSSHCRK